jgi:ribosomal-protein-alanine N-acetyltransferase
MTFNLVPCDHEGSPTQTIPEMPTGLTENCRATADLYQRVGFSPPWIGYVATVDGRGVGGGAFVGPPRDGFVEIAYFTLEHELGKGFASRTAAALMRIAQTADPLIGLKAFTLKEENPSTRILMKLGFTIVGTAKDEHAGDVWEWRLSGR